MKKQALLFTILMLASTVIIGQQNEGLISPELINISDKDMDIVINSDDHNTLNNVVWMNDSVHIYFDNLNPDDWLLSRKILNTFDDNGFGIQSIKYNWSGLQWDFQIKNDFINNEVGKPEVRISSKWNTLTNEWKFLFRTTYFYNEMGDLMERLVEKWDTPDFPDSWEFILKYEYEYSDGALNKISSYNWESDIEFWVLSAKFNYSYNAEGLIVDIVENRWDDVLEDWMLFFKKTYNYDDSGYLVNQIGESWDEELTGWAFSSKNEYDNDENGNSLSSIIYSWDNVINDWDPNTQETYFWSSLILGITENSKSKWVKIFPNPAGEYLNIKLKQNVNVLSVDIVGINGKVYYTSSFTSLKQDYLIDLSNISPGIYLIKIRGDTFSKTEKLIIR